MSSPIALLVQLKLSSRLYIYDFDTLDKLASILDLGAIGSRVYLEKNGIKYKSSFKLDIPYDKEWLYYPDGVHEDRVSLSDPNNRFVRRSIERKDSSQVACYSYNFLTLLVSRDVPIVSSENTKGLALGEVQVIDRIDNSYIIGILVPFDDNALLDERNLNIIENIKNICKFRNYELNIYNYDGKILNERNKEM